MRALRAIGPSTLVLALVDIAAAALSCWLAYTLRFEAQPALPTRYVVLYLASSAAVALASVASGRLAGLYRRSVLRPAERVTEPALESALTTTVLLLVVNYLILDGQLSRAWIGLVALFLLLSAIGTRWVLSRLRRALVPFGIALERYALVGDGPEVQRLAGDLTRAAGAPFHLVATLSPGIGAARLAEFAATRRLDGLILTAGAEPREVGTLASLMSGFGVDVFLAPRLGDLDLRVASIASFHGVPLLRLAGVAPRRKAVRTRPTGKLHRGVAIMGTRGIPANYGGFETFAERLALHLVQAGIPVTVYCRRHHATGAKTWQGVRLVTLPSVEHKYLDTVLHTALSAMHLLTRTRIRDVVLCNAANAPVLPLLRLARRRVVMNVDGLEWRRGKWGVVGRSWYRLGEWLSVRASAVLVTDAEEIRTYYRVRHDTDSVMVPYGADLLNRHLPLPAGLPVLPDGFALYVSRWEPENNPLLVAQAHAAAGVDLPLVMLGRATYHPHLEEQVRAEAAATAILPGPLFGEDYRGLLCNARCYIHATEVGGTHPALIEAMGAGNLCLVLDTPENREVAGAAAWYFGDQQELSALMHKVVAASAEELGAVGALARDRAGGRYSWDAVGDKYLGLMCGDV